MTASVHLHETSIIEHFIKNVRQQPRRRTRYILTDQTLITVVKD